MAMLNYQRVDIFLNPNECPIVFFDVFWGPASKIWRVSIFRGLIFGIAFSCL